MSDSDRSRIPEPERLCDHICLKDDGHVERGETHFYGYELPSPRTEVERLLGELVEARTLADTQRAQIERLALEAAGYTYTEEGVAILVEVCRERDDLRRRFDALLARERAAAAERDVERARADQLQADLHRTRELAERVRMSLRDQIHERDAELVVLREKRDQLQADLDAARSDADQFERMFTLRSAEANEHYAELVVLREKTARSAGALEAIRDLAYRQDGTDDHGCVVAVFKIAAAALLTAGEAEQVRRALAGSVVSPPPADDRDGWDDSAGWAGDLLPVELLIPEPPAMSDGLRFELDRGNAPSPFCDNCGKTMARFRPAGSGPCPACNGRGVVKVDGRVVPEPCPECSVPGSVPVPPQENHDG